MSALGQKQTLPHVHAMSVLPRKRTFTATIGLSASANSGHVHLTGHAGCYFAHNLSSASSPEPISRASFELGSMS
jgi:hypothetical protein